MKKTFAKYFNGLFSRKDKSANAEDSVKTYVIKGFILAGVFLAALLFVTMSLKQEIQDTPNRPKPQPPATTQGTQEPTETQDTQDTQDIQTIQVGAICYHKFYTEAELAAGKELDTYTIWVSEFEAHLQYLQEQNIRVITVSELQAYVNGEIDLPQKCMLLTVDDCDISFYKYAYPLLEEYGVKVNAAVIGDRTDWSSEGTAYSEIYCNWDQLKEMQDAGVVEYGSHTYNLHDQKEGRKGTMQKEGESVEDYRQVLINDLNPLNEKLESMFGYRPAYFVYPYYAVSQPSVAIMQEDLGYNWLFCGNTASVAGYLGDSVHASNYNPFTKGQEPANIIIKRYTPRSGDDFVALIHTIFD